MLRIEAVEARQILDSRGYPTVSVRLVLEGGAVTEASAPAGASTGGFEALELRDGTGSFEGRGVHSAIMSVTGELGRLLRSRPWESLRQLDEGMRALDGTDNLSRLGANAVVAVSLAAARGFAHTCGEPLYGWLARLCRSELRLPVPHFNVLNGGAHATNALDFQEFMIAPVGAQSMTEAVETGAAVYHALAALLRSRYGGVGLGDEGGFAPEVSDPRTALDVLVEAIEAAGAVASPDAVALAIDPAANGFYRGDGIYRFAGRDRGREELVEYYVGLIDDYPLRSIEDGFAETDVDGWRIMADAAGSRVQLVGDDIYVTDPARIREGAQRGYSNAALIKPNQIGTVSSTIDAIAAAYDANMRCMVSHRSGETTDDFIADLAVGAGTGQIKSGAPARGERVAKYNRLMQIEEERPDLPYGPSAMKGALR